MNIQFNAAVRTLALRGILVASMLAGGAMSATRVHADSDRVSFQPVAEAQDRGGDEPTVYEAAKPVFVQNPALPGFLQELSGDLDVLVAVR